MKYLLAAFLFGSCTESGLQLPEKDTFAVEFSVAGISAEVTTTRAGVALENDRQVRILAFRRISSTPDLSKDEFMGEAVYKASGGNGALSAVGTPLCLRADTYDFYALTPDLAVTRPNPTGGGGTCTVSVDHGMDYAASFTSQKPVTEGSPVVTLATLVRHCTKLTFALSPKYQNITSVNISSAGLTNQTHGPLSASLPTSLDNGKFLLDGVALDAQVTLPGTAFTSPDAVNAPHSREASTVILPRKAGAFKFKMSVAFNGLAATGLEANLPADLVFAEGTHYTFTVKMKGGSVQLVLRVEPWGNEDSDVSIGDPGTTSIELVVGEWTDVDTDALLGGGDKPVTVGGWELNEENWSGAIGDYPGLTTGGALPWNPNEENLPSDTGGGTGGEEGSTSSGGWNTDQVLDTPVEGDETSTK